MTRTDVDTATIALIHMVNKNQNTAFGCPNSFSATDVNITAVIDIILYAAVMRLRHAIVGKGSFDYMQGFNIRLATKVVVKPSVQYSLGFPA